MNENSHSSKEIKDFNGTAVSADDSAASDAELKSSRRKLLKTVGGGTAIGIFGGLAGNGTFSPVGTASAQSNAWRQQNQLAAADGEDGDVFGFSAAIADNADTAVISAVGRDQDSSQLVGAAYIFTQEAGSWSQQQKLTANNAEPQTQFGREVALSTDGTTLFVGAPGNNDAAGAVYVYSRSNGRWNQQQKLTASSRSSDDAFGYSVSISTDGTTALVGAVNDMNGTTTRTGSVSVFIRSPTGWSHQQTVTPPDSVEKDAFGRAVALSADGSTAIIGASRHEYLDSENVGAAYIFTRSDGTWSPQEKLTGDPDDLWAPFGISVSLSDDASTALVGTKIADTQSSSPEESAYVFTRDNDEWIRQQQLTTDADSARENNLLPVSLSNDGTTAFVCDPYEKELTGSVYAFSRDRGEWNQQQQISVDLARGGLFGTSIAVSDDTDTVLVGAGSDTNVDGEATGSAYILTTQSDDDTDSDVVPDDLPASISPEQYRAVAGADGDLTLEDLVEANIERIRNNGTIQTPNGRVEIQLREIVRLNLYRIRN